MTASHTHLLPPVTCSLRTQVDEGGDEQNQGYHDERGEQSRVDPGSENQCTLLLFGLIPAHAVGRHRVRDRLTGWSRRAFGRR